jgi:hypothetical protein
LEHNQLTVNKRETVLADIVTVGGMEREDIGSGEWGTSSKALKKEGAVWVLVVSGSPVQGGRDRARRRTGKATGNKTGRGLGCVEVGEKVNVDQMVHKMAAELERATSSETGSERSNRNSQGDSRGGG